MKGIFGILFLVIVACNVIGIETYQDVRDLPKDLMIHENLRDAHSRVKRQLYPYGFPYPRRHYPLPVIVGHGGYYGFGRGFGGFGRGYGSHAFGGRGFGGRGFGGRGIGGHGFGGRGGGGHGRG